ncbi:hypothetical protein WJX81_001594 [Elliptochloris bilobata]|uniref:NFACT RNA-binding domain-containing protein n=1 Tax=Elliptochloris bilobata TaxID=381761 RepID=A0AAW1SFL4_9CHLO
MGRDKIENEDLIRYGLPLDVWFHVDDLSSAHVYLRLPAGRSIDDIPTDTLEDCAQLVKANSIQGNKAASVDVVYTPWANLRKTAAMEVGQVGFKDQKQVRKVPAVKRVNDVVNRLNRSRREAFPNLAAEREAFEKEVRSAKKVELQTQRRAEKAAREAAQKEREQRSYSHLMQDDNMMTRAELGQKYKSVQELEDDFM